MSIKNFKIGIQDWLDERSGLSNVIKFLREKKIPQHKHSIWYYTGSAILLFFTIQVITGFVLVFYYNPTLEEANKSVGRIMTEVPFGWIIRSVHSWSASFMIAFVFIHLLSIWITKSYRKPREATWMSGVFLLVFTLAFGFTGYLLPWDDLSLAATKVGTDIPRSIPVVGIWGTKFLRGGEDITGDTLTRFFGFHVSILPVLLIILLAVHIYLIQKHGMSLPLAAERKKEKFVELPFWPNFVYREMVVWLFLVGILFSVAVFLPPSLEKAADLMAPAPEGIKPEWYFLFLFQTLKIFPSTILFISGDTIAVLLILLGVILFFFLPLIDNKPAKRKGKIITVIAYAFIVYAIVMTAWSLM
ncbi:MAG: cytochrome bc complex cytochrome b subunit [Candidatus Aminicenantes bacterium]|nr:MAG: cytochrome bc complex cytochrome b subunit [Candidatus Aminicenantes bacterium]